MTDPDGTFRPDWASAPGDTIADLIEERGWSQIEVARRLGYTTKHVSLLINGKAPVTEETALCLERVLGSTARFWLTREAQYRAQRASLDAAKRAEGWGGWCDRLPVRELMEAGAIVKRRVDVRNNPQIVEDLLRFFGVASPDEWERHYAGMQVALRRTREVQSDIGAISAWLRLGELEAEKLDGPRYDRTRFADALRQIRKLTLHAPDEFEPRMLALCQNAGVALVLVPSIPRAHVSGAARWLSPHRPLIQLSLYGKTNDRFWFTFFHEAAHILLHGRKGIFLDELGTGAIGSQEETEADEWAGDFLIPQSHQDELPFLKSKQPVAEYAQRIGIHPGIVVGRLQHDQHIDQSWMNDLKVSLSLVSAAAS